MAVAIRCDKSGARARSFLDVGDALARSLLDGGDAPALSPLDGGDAPAASVLAHATVAAAVAVQRDAKAVERNAAGVGAGAVVRRWTEASAPPSTPEARSRVPPTMAPRAARREAARAAASFFARVIARQNKLLPSSTMRRSRCMTSSIWDGGGMGGP